ncbi:MAG: hypothetical protein WCG28_02665 [bacterium]
MEVPGGTNTDIVVLVTIPVVDIETVLVEVTDARDVASIGLTYIACFHPYHQELSFTVFTNLYTLFSVLDMKLLTLYQI